MFPGWESSTENIRTWEELPEKCREYVLFIESFIQVCDSTALPSRNSYDETLPCCNGVGGGGGKCLRIRLDLLVKHRQASAESEKGPLKHPAERIYSGARHRITQRSQRNSCMGRNA